MPAHRLKSYLDERDTDYVTIGHTETYTAQQTAQSADIARKALAKTVVMKMNGQLVMVVLPASSRVDIERLKRALGTADVTFALEQEFKDEFPDCEVGAMPPFGNLYGMPVFVSQALREDEEICFNAGTHTELIRLPYADFESLVQPTPITV
jgi:Ala-tRNA(Pro) deacylase